jgi:hypothetical protein
LQTDTEAFPNSNSNLNLPPLFIHDIDSFPSIVSLLKKKRTIPNAVLPLPDKNQHVRSSALFTPNIIHPKNTTDSPMCKEMLA